MLRLFDGIRDNEYSTILHSQNSEICNQYEAHISPISLCFDHMVIHNGLAIISTNFAGK